MRHIYFWGLILFLFGISIQGYCQINTGIIKGKIMDHAEGPVPYATVALDSIKIGTISDSNGVYTLNNVPVGAHKITISALGYTIQVKSIKVKANENQLNFELKEDHRELDEVVVQGKSVAQAIRETPFSVTSIELKEMKNLSVDMNSVMNRVPGLRVRESGSLGSDMNITLNGMNSLRIFIDGLPADGFGTSFSFNNFPVNIIERIDVYRGVTPVFLGGDVLGGAINIITKKDNVKFLDASYSYGSFNTHQASLSGRYISKKGIAVNSSAFFNHSDNDYPVDIMGVIDSTNLLKPINIRRPNNHYTSAGVTAETGVVNKTWADRLLIGGVFSANRKGLQATTMTSPPVMHAFRREFSFSPTVKYEKRNLFIKGLDLKMSGLYTNVQSESIDTNRTAYYWDGRLNPRITSENTKAKSFVENGSYTINTITNVMYQPADKHSFVLSHNWNRYTRKSHDRYATETSQPPVGKITKHIMGLSYQLALFQKRWVTTLFAKGYFMNSSTNSENMGQQATDIFIPGRGIASTFRIGIFQLKASYEYAVTLPNAEQIFGDGTQFSQPNPNLKPEESNNVNAGVMLNKQWGSHSVMAEGNFFYRNPHNYIRMYSNGTVYQYRNDDVVRIRGVEGNIRYAYKDLLYADASLTYQDKRVDTRYLPSGKKNPLYGDRIPNEPFFYGNLNVGAFTKVQGHNKWRIGLNWNTAYTEAFPLGFESQSYEPIYIPQQLSHDLSFTYSLFSGKYNLGLTCRNIINTLLMDNFSVPKPGRSFSIKLRVNLYK